METKDFAAIGRESLRSQETDSDSLGGYAGEWQYFAGR